MQKTFLMVWVFALIITAISALAQQESQKEALLGHEWKWQETIDAKQQKTIPATPSNYTISFMADGTIAAKVDCNQGGGTYNLVAEEISIRVTHTTRAMCAPDSLDTTYLEQLDAAQTVAVQGKSMVFELKGTRGSMTFTRD